MNAASSPPGLPLVVQVAFAGSRLLFDPKAHPQLDAAIFHAAVQTHLTARLRQLPEELGLGDRRYSFCGLSALAIGGDTLFTRACQTLNWPQRLFLPQQREDFLNARGSEGTADFSEAQREEARNLFASPHIIEEHVVSEARDRHERFDDVNLELARVCDLLVCLVRANAAGQSGGTLEALAHATRRDRPVLELRVSVDSAGQPVIEEQWHHREKFVPPSLPKELAGLQTNLKGLPTAAEYCKQLQDFVKVISKKRQGFFKSGALLVVTAHFAATFLAVAALKAKGTAVLQWILGFELAFLASGLLIHELLHGSGRTRWLAWLPRLVPPLGRFSHAVSVWAMSRLVSEVAVSTLALRAVPAALAHLFSLPLPESLRPLLCVLNVIHLRDTCALPPAVWAAQRNGYVHDRVTAPQRGQIPYYEGKLRDARRGLRLARRVFLAGSLGAIAFTTLKLVFVFSRLPVPDAWHNTLESLFGALAILLPVVAVAAMSLAAAYDLEARVHTFGEMLTFLQRQERHLNEAPSEHAFHHLALETEAKLLGETAAWYARRAFTGIA